MLVQDVRNPNAVAATHFGAKSTDVTSCKDELITLMELMYDQRDASNTRTSNPNNQLTPYNLLSRIGDQKQHIVETYDSATIVAAKAALKKDSAKILSKRKPAFSHDFWSVVNT